MLLVGLVAAVAIMMILSTIAVQHWADVLRRDNEAEMMFRAQEIVRAIRKYQRDKPGQPLLELKLLMEPGSKRQFFLRKLYKDPLVKDGKWGLLFAAPQGGVYDPTAEPIPGQPGAPGAPGGPGGGLGGLTAGSGLTAGTAGAPGAPPGQLGRTGEVSGLPIVGVKSLSEDKPFRLFKDSEDYARWLFTVFDLDQQVAGQGQLPPGAPPVGSGAPPQPGEPNKPNTPNTPGTEKPPGQ
jgi:type II secretory pathway pseudopilin PulG